MISTVFNPASIGIKTDPSAKRKAPAPAPVEVNPYAVEPHSVLARAVYEVYNGTPAIVCEAAPGSGKTTLVCALIRQLRHRLPELKIGVAVIGADAVHALAERLGDTLGKDSKGRLQVYIPRGDSTMADIHHNQNIALKTSPNNQGESPVFVTTTRSMEMLKSYEPDVLIIDEAYMLTYNAFTGVACRATQVVLVGDPGQIGPIVNANVNQWEPLSAGPHLRAPEVLTEFENVTRLSLGTSYRLGAQTTALIEPLYDFPVTSARPAQHILKGSKPLAEMESIELVNSDGISDMVSMEAVADRAIALTALEHWHVKDGTTPMTARRVAVVVPHNAQGTAIRAILKSKGHDDITVGTADSLQGGQWDAVVAVDPMLGHEVAKSHQLSTGRLCVMLSRHTSHLSWFYPTDWREGLAEVAATGNKDAALGLSVRDSLIK